MGLSLVTRQALTTIDQASIQALGLPFSQAVAQHCPEEIISKPTGTDRKRQRKILRRCTKHLKSQMGENDSITVLAENQSLSSYKRMRMSQSFETPEQKRSRYAKQTTRSKRHSPKFDKVKWDTETLRATLES